VYQQPCETARMYYTILTITAAVSAAHQTDQLRSQPDESDVVNVDDNQAHNGTVVPVRRRPNNLMRVPERLPVRLSSPLQLVGINHVDPFEMYPSELPKQVVSPALAQGW
jgi:hypothetical protein